MFTFIFRVIHRIARCNRCTPHHCHILNTLRTSFFRRSLTEKAVESEMNSDFECVIAYDNSMKKEILIIFISFERIIDRFRVVIDDVRYCRLMSVGICRKTMCASSC